jgi:hypothetical protein
MPPLTKIKIQPNPFHEANQDRESGASLPVANQ